MEPVSLRSSQVRFVGLLAEFLVGSSSQDERGWRILNLRMFESNFACMCHLNLPAWRWVPVWRRVGLNNRLNPQANPHELLSNLAKGYHGHIW